MMKKAVLLCIATLLLTVYSVCARTKDVKQWARQFSIPGFDIIWSTSVGFGHCFTLNPNDKQWHDCADPKGVVSESYVERKTNVEYQFTTPTPGKCYSIMEATIDENAWFYQHIKVFFYKYNPAAEKWNGMAGPGKIYTALLKGKNLVYNYDYAVKIAKGRNPLPHVENPEGTVTLKTVLPTLEAGTYKIIFRSADRGQDVFLPSKARLAVFLSPDRHSVSSGSSGTLPSPNPVSDRPGTSSPPPPGGTHGTVLHPVPTPQPSPPATRAAADLSGKWEITCIGNIVYKFDLWIEQSGNHFIGNMIRTNGSDPYTSLEGTVHHDGALEFTRRTGNWRQHYLGRITRQSGTRPAAMEGKFGNHGQETMDWNAVKQ